MSNFEVFNEEALASDFVPKSKPYVFKNAPERFTKVLNEHAAAACLKIYKITAAENQATQVISRHSKSFQLLLQICQRLYKML